MTEEELFETLDLRHHEMVEGWLSRGDGVAVYEHSAFDSALRGHRKFVSYGSDKSQLGPDHCAEGRPPQRLPDIGEQINWAYQLVATVTR